MRPGGGPAKGASFERKVCVQLSLWITGGKLRDCFWRSSLSGGRATVAFQRGVRLDRQAGDICAIAPEGHVLTDQFYFELKHYRSIKLESFILFNRGLLAQWWQQAIKQANRHDRQPVIIAKSNRVPAIVITKVGNILLNPHPVAILPSCSLGLFDRTLKIPWMRYDATQRPIPTGPLEALTAREAD